MRAILGTLVKNASWLLVGDVVVKVALLLVVAAVARGMGAASLGIFTVTLGTALVLIPLLALGQAEVLIREVARSPRHAPRLLAASRRAQLRWALLVVPPGALAMLLPRDASLRLTLLAFLPYVLLRVEMLTRGAVFKGLDRMDVEVRARVVETVLGLLLVAGLATAGAPVWTVPLALALGAAAGCAILTLEGQGLAREEEPPPPFPLRHGFAFLGLAVTFQLLLRSDTFLAAGFGVDSERIGYYGAAAGLVWGLLALPQLVALASYPLLSRLAASGERSRTPALAAGAVGLAFGLAAASVLWWLRREVLVLIFGSDFTAAAELLGRLAWAFPAASMSMILGVVLAAWHRQNQALVLLTLVLSISLLFNLVMIPRAGMLGAAAVAVAAHSLGALANLVLALRPNPIRTGSG